MVRVGAQGLYISMFDEFGEGNQIVDTAPDSSTVPTNSGLLALNEDGTACSSDYYLRLTADGGRMLKGQIALTATRPTPPTTTPPNPDPNLALGRPTSASGYTQVYQPSNAVDGNTSSSELQIFATDRGCLRGNPLGLPTRHPRSSGDASG